MVADNLSAARAVRVEVRRAAFRVGGEFGNVFRRELCEIGRVSAGVIEVEFERQLNLFGVGNPAGVPCFPARIFKAEERRPCEGL